jgi:hypothetical protein
VEPGFSQYTSLPARMAAMGTGACHKVAARAPTETAITLKKFDDLSFRPS